MIYINGYWESSSTLDKCIDLVREYNKELAAKIVELLPVHTDEEYYELFKECEMAKMTVMTILMSFVKKKIQ